MIAQASQDLSFPACPFLGTAAFLFAGQWRHHVDAQSSFHAGDSVASEQLGEAFPGLQRVDDLVLAHPPHRLGTVLRALQELQELAIGGVGRRQGASVAQLLDEVLVLQGRQDGLAGVDTVLPSRSRASQKRRASTLWLRGEGRIPP